MDTHQQNLYACNICYSVLNNMRGATKHFQRVHKERFDELGGRIEPELRKLDDDAVGIQTAAK
jgi:hypothetical protein